MDSSKRHFKDAVYAQLARAGKTLSNPKRIELLDLLAQGPLERIRECPGQGTCGWLFLDLSKNASRRWCDMRVCGNRAKARRHYERTLAPANRSRSRAASAV